MQSGYYPIEFKYKVLQDMFEHHLSLQETALKYGIPSPCTVLVWKRKYDKKGLFGLNDGSRIWSESMVKKDDMDCALNAGADYIVTNDRHFNILKNIDFP
ncbi:MAG: helix-turn-helix domain-containing protein [Bacteroidales bacterium]|jgi:hypothetical protein|nr:helix-turn-helix domain-containing protein [Bacteroidales bacterium]